MSAQAVEDPRTRIAFHEAGHAVVAVVLGWQLGPVTTVPSEHYGGFVLTHSAEEIPEDDAAFAGPLPLMPATVRRKFEAAACVFLAGGLAEELRSESLRWAEQIRWAEGPTPRPRRQPEPSPQHDENVSPPELSSADEAAIEQQRQRPGATDVENVWDFATRFAGTSSSLAVPAAFVQYCTAVTRDLLAHNWSAVERLAAALLMHRTLSGEAARSVIQDQALPAANRALIDEPAAP